MRLFSFVGPLAVLLVGCGGGGGGGPTPPPPVGSTVVVSGKITFDRIPFDTTLGGGLNPAAPVESPARHVVVEAIGSSNAVLATATTDASGDFALTVPRDSNIFLRAKARMLKTSAAPTWDFSVLDNTTGDALWTLDGSSFNSGSANSTRNLRAASGWSGTDYTGTRAAAPFAILDTIYKAKELILTANAAAVFPALNLYWSPDNRTTITDFCPRTGDIGTSFYITAGAENECTPQGQVAEGIYILGDFQGGSGDTDEFDQHVLAHEFGHYVEDKFARSDSIGGRHGGGDLLDLRVAFGEGWGNAFSAMVLGDPIYRDSAGGVDDDGGFNLEADSTIAEGWFSEASVGEILWDIFDATADSGDNVALAFAPIYSVLTSTAVVQTEALTSIFPFATALRAANAAASAAIGTLLGGESISGTDEFGNSEDNEGTDPTVLPIYTPIALNTPINVCSRSTAGSEDGNKLGNRRFLRFVNDQARAVTIQAAGAAPNGSSVAATDPDIFVLNRGAVAASGESTVAGNETISQVPLAAGTYIIEVYDFEVIGTNQPPRCMNVSIQG